MERITFEKFFKRLLYLAAKEKIVFEIINDKDIR